MPSSERRNPELSALRASITELESVGTDYADFLLMDTAVHVDLNNIIGGFTLPPKAAEAFAEHAIPAPKSVDSMNLDLTYDRGVGRFEILSGAVEFDNKYVVAFSHPRSFKGHDDNLHRLDLFTRDAKGSLKMKSIGLSSNLDVRSFFSQCGVNIPVAPMSASWDETVPPLLSSAEQGVVTAQKITPVTPLHEMVITEQTVESSSALPSTARGNQRPSWLSKAIEYDFPDDSTGGITQVWDRLISLQLITHNPLGATAIEAILRSNSAGHTPAFKGVYYRTGKSSEVISHKPKSNHILGSTQLMQLDGELIVPTAELTQYIAFMTAAIRSANSF